MLELRPFNALLILDNASATALLVTGRILPSCTLSITAGKLSILLLNASEIASPN